jgi:hypothetical protein
VEFPVLLGRYWDTPLKVLWYGTLGDRHFWGHRQPCRTQCQHRFCRRQEHEFQRAMHTSAHLQQQSIVLLRER